MLYPQFVMRPRSAWRGTRRLVEYDLSLVVYTDMLGFEELVRTRTANQLSKIIRVFQEVMDTRIYRQRRQGVPPEYIMNFSDLTVFSTPVRKSHFPAKGAVFFQLLGLVHAQVSLAHEEGIVVVKSHKQLYGPGVIDAYRIESKTAKYPRIVVDRSVLNELAGNENLCIHDREDELNAVNGLLRKDEEDGILYVDYLRVIQGECEGREFEDFAEKHDALIKMRLQQYSGDIAVREKYEWLRRYHNSTLKMLGS